MLIRACSPVLCASHVSRLTSLDLGLIPVFRAFHPWRAPGSTPGLDPCGLAGGARTNMSMRVRDPDTRALL